MQSAPSPVRDNRTAPAALFLVALLWFGGCDSTDVDPFVEDGYYSVFGYVNARADTHFVRVEALRDSSLLDTGPLGAAEVTITHVGSGERVTLQDSIFSYGEAGRAHNFWTAALPIRPRATYRLTVRGPNGETTRSAPVTVPALFPPPVQQGTRPVPLPGDCPPLHQLPNLSVRAESLRIRGIERLVAVNTYISLVRDPPGPTPPVVNSYTYQHLADTVHLPDGSVRAVVDYGKDLCYTRYNRTGELRTIKVVVVAGNPEWPDFLALTFEEQALPGIASNIENGVGLFGAVVSDTVTIYHADSVEAEVPLPDS